MIPLSFDPITAREVTGDEQARILEAKARKDAAAGIFDPPTYDFKDDSLSYWDKVQKEMHFIIYRRQYEKRMARNARKSASTSIDA